MISAADGKSWKRDDETVVDDGIVLRSRVRLARNLKDERFPEWATEADRERTCAELRKAVLTEYPGARVGLADSVEKNDGYALCESHLISRDLLHTPRGSSVIYAQDHSFSIMINEEDHLRIQGFAVGLALRDSWRIADSIDNALERHVQYAWSPRLGYLTACPTNVGTGLRAGAMLHLLGLRLLGEIDPVIRGLDRLRLLVRGIGGEGSEAAGQIYQISNMDALGRREEEVVERVERICREIARLECNARQRLKQSMPLVLGDCLARSLSMLQNARLLSTAEALEFLSALRLGAAMGLCTRLRVATVDKLILTMQPGHLQQWMGVPLTTEQRDEYRARFLRDRVSHIRLKY